MIFWPSPTPSARRRCGRRLRIPRRASVRRMPRLKPRRLRKAPGGDTCASSASRPKPRSRHEACTLEAANPSATGACCGAYQGASTMPKISPDLLSVLRCPVTGSTLVQEGEELVSTAAGQSGESCATPLRTASRCCCRRSWSLPRTLRLRTSTTAARAQWPAPQRRAPPAPNNCPAGPSPVRLAPNFP